MCIKHHDALCNAFMAVMQGCISLEHFMTHLNTLLMLCDCVSTRNSNANSHTFCWTLNLITFAVCTETLFNILSNLAAQCIRNPSNARFEWHLNSHAIHRLLSKLREGNVFSRVCSSVSQSICPGGVLHTVQGPTLEERTSLRPPPCRARPAPHRNI